MCLGFRTLAVAPVVLSVPDLLTFHYHVADIFADSPGHSEWMEGMKLYRYGFPAKEDDFNRSLELFTKATNSGHPSAPFFMYKCAQKLKKKDTEAKALSLLQKSSYGPAAYVRALIFQDSVDFDDRDATYNILCKWTDAADATLKDAQKGDTASQYLLAACRENESSNGGEDIDEAEMFKVYLAAAEQGHPQGMEAVGRAYHHGQGVKKDSAKAIEWLKKAEALGNRCAASLSYYFDRDIKEEKEREQAAAAASAASATANKKKPA